MQLNIAIGKYGLIRLCMAYSGGSNENRDTGAR